MSLLLGQIVGTDASVRQGIIRVQIDCFESEKQVCLSVTDTGIGIRPEDQKVVFEEFRQVEGRRDAVNEGTGLGLWISREIIGRHGGSLKVRSSQSPHSSGTVFTIFLPSLAASFTLKRPAISSYPPELAIVEHYACRGL